MHEKKLEIYLGDVKMLIRFNKVNYLSSVSLMGKRLWGYGDRGQIIYKTRLISIESQPKKVVVVVVVVFVVVIAVVFVVVVVVVDVVVVYDDFFVHSGYL